MPFQLSYIRSDGTNAELTIEIGETLFVLGANGTGKSSLMHLFYSLNHGQARRISAHRQTWFSSNAIDLSPAAKRSTEQNISNQDTHPQSRWRDDYSAQRSSIAIYDLIDAENVRARQIAGAVDAGDFGLAEILSKKDAPIKVINELLRQSNIPVEIDIQASEQVVAKKNGGAPYSIAELSDGERNALLIAASVLTAKPGTLVLIDEPERHLHRSIISPLLTLLFATRGDCAFVVSTHDLMLPLDNDGSRTLLVRSCVFSGSSVQSWEADLIPAETEIDEELKKDIIGSRRKILFVEGNERSLDKPLYSLILPMASLAPKTSCRDVEHAVYGIRSSSSLHWLHAWGIIDNDGRTNEDIERLKQQGVHPLPFYSVESIYYHPEMIRRVAERYSAVVGDDPATCVQAAEQAAFSAMTTPHIQRLSARVAEKSIRELIFRQLPRSSDVQAGIPINISVDAQPVVAGEIARIQAAVDQRDLLTIVTRYPVRETPVLTEIAKKLGFLGREPYEKAVRKLLMDDADALAFVRSLFGTLADEIQRA